MSSELDRVDLDEVKVKTQQRSYQPKNESSTECKEQRGSADELIIHELCPSLLNQKECAEHDTGNNEREYCDPDEAPEVQDALAHKSAQAGLTASDITE